MLINGAPINSAALNSSSGGESRSEPQPIVPGLAFRWRLSVLVNGVDLSARLTGQMSVDRERGAAGVASFTLQMLPGPVLPMDWVGRTVTIDYITAAQGVTTRKRRYTGRIITTEWDPLMRLLVCHCGDQLQQRVEAMTVADVSALIPSYWAPEVFEAPEGRSRWTYAQECLGTIQQSLDSSADGALRLTSWYAGPEDYVFGDGTTIYNTVKVSYADLSSLTNKVEVDANYRFPRLHQRVQGYIWVHPDTRGSGGTQGFCAWRRHSSELPDIEMVKSAATGAGYSILETAWDRLPLTNTNPCGDGIPWANIYPDLLLGASVLGGRRFTQAVTEKYTLSVVAEESIAQAGEVISRQSLSVEFTSDFAEKWESNPFGMDVPGNVPPALEVGTGHIDERSEAQRLSAFRCVLNQAKTAIVLAHTATTISWDVPTSMVLDIDLVHTLRVTDQGVSARARCSRVQDSFDLAGGTAITTFSIAVMRGGGSVSDALVPPAAPIVEQEESAPFIELATQLGRLNDSPPYREDLDGFSGNSDAGNNAIEGFPRRFQIVSPEIPATERNESNVAVGATYRVAIPNDLLEM
ncbi:hypothetical protein [Pseudomonas gingeri]|uniref:hypothetical protein n=1 Tax=Pseudomonas gingeri TaxID=117681 RepID=UPI0015C1147F|nr:hypothetical protein [Pseudomonas gingeri]NWD49016.1 hypothetical protein [Pseudomonas gingeri]